MCSPSFTTNRFTRAETQHYKDVETITPFIELTYKLSRRNSLRMEASVSNDGAGSWAVLSTRILELNMSPRYSFLHFRHGECFSGAPEADAKVSDEVVHYWSVFGKVQHPHNVIHLSLCSPGSWG